MTTDRLPLRRLRLSLTCLLLLCAAPASHAVARALPMREIAQGVYLHQGLHEESSRANAGDIANVGFIVGSRCVAVIDTGGSFEVGRQLLHAIRLRSAKPICYVIHTHAHPDHVFGDAAFLSRRPVYVAHARYASTFGSRWSHYRRALVRELGQQRAGPGEMIAPGLTVTGQMSLDLGARTLLLRAWPTAHSNADLTIWDSRTGTLWLGDLLFERRVPALDGSINGWLDVLDEMRRLPVRLAVPGHGAPSRLWPGALEAQTTYLRELRQEVRAALRQGKTLAQAAEAASHDDAGQWLLFSEYQPRNVTAAYAELEWEKR
ncbi:quinoprotein relay system zinc metallohydrolase 2 [Noviherbaspirillum pedocola]|uniref:Quinoprotein relay system zinc metallohydrolase 2 n=1 Tax=Noviherbaspirillum pedocola TaxID=2801341 RepID=A0A934STJ3_9BURK|nr:quinoprotein relay system zinc metallohydrolase 2 [Noviherbaspirillum pedocola]MBK4734946.1 quinoprotein relay system zinc metallohydrolase 2 [Noviherbaspirillum pedocola]